MLRPSRRPHPPRAVDGLLDTVFPGVFCFFLGVAAAAATTADDLCDTLADPCVVSLSILATPNSVIDVGQRELQVTGSGALRVNSGGLTLRGRRIVTGASTTLRTSGTRPADAAAPLVIEADEVVLTGEIDVRGSPAGSVDITATQSLTVSNRLRGQSLTADESASSVNLTSANVLLAGSIELRGGSADFGGDITVAGDSILIIGSIDVSGGDGGAVDISASQGLVLAASASITADATTAAGGGGEITLRSDAALEVSGSLRANGRRGGIDDGGGDGGAISLAGDTRVSLPATSALVEALGAPPDGGGGEIEIVSFLGSIDIRGTVSTSSDSNEGSGGLLDVSAETTFDLFGMLASKGAAGGGGDIDIEAGDSVVVRPAGLIDSSTTRNANAGSVTIAAGGAIEVAGRMLANSAQSTAGMGGTIDLDACAVTIASGAELRCRGPRGANNITAAGAIVIGGSLSSGPTDGVNQLRFPAEGPLPVTGGASIVPGASLVADPQLLPCVPLPATPTPQVSATPTASLTALPTSTPSPTVSQVPVSCPGDCDGNGTVSIAELIRAVNIALENDDVANCRAADSNGDGRVTINELIQAVNSALQQCPA